MKIWTMASLWNVLTRHTETFSYMYIGVFSAQRTAQELGFSLNTHCVYSKSFVAYRGWIVRMLLSNCNSGLLCLNKQSLFQLSEGTVPPLHPHHCAAVELGRGLGTYRTSQHPTSSISVFWSSLGNWLFCCFGVQQIQHPEMISIQWFIEYILLHFRNHMTWISFRPPCSDQLEVKSQKWILSKTLWVPPYTQTNTQKISVDCKTRHSSLYLHEKKISSMRLLRCRHGLFYNNKAGSCLVFMLYKHDHLDSIFFHMLGFYNTILHFKSKYTLNSPCLLLWDPNLLPVSQMHSVYLLQGHTTALIPTDPPTKPP